MLAPNENEYVLYLESETVPVGLAAEIDAELAANPQYRLCRALGQLAPVRIQTVRPGAYGRYLEECRRRGQRWGDVKPLALSPVGGWEEIFTPP